MAEAGLGCAIIPETMAKIPSVPAKPRLFSFGDPVTKWELSIAYREGMLFSNTAIEFINMVKNIYKDSGLG